MNTTELITPPAVRGRPAPEPAPFREMVAEIAPLVEAVPGEGPPFFLLAGWWVLLALMLSGPFAFLVVLVLAMVVAAALVAAVAAAIYVIVTAPYRLVRRARRASASARAPQLVPVPPTRVVA
jgi:hypothetical protein